MINDQLKFKTIMGYFRPIGLVGFNVDIGPQNQGVFSNFSVSQEQGLATAEAIRQLNEMANLGGNRAASTQSNSLFNVYKNRSYTCTVEMMGNAMIQPTMYFNLRYVPMFSGPYMITGVDHSISQGSFQTRFTGVRQPVANLPLVDNYLQTLLKSLVKMVKDEIERQKQKESQSGSTSNNTISQATEKTETGNNSSCTPYSSFSDYEPIVDPTKTNLSIQDMVTNIKLIRDEFTIPNKNALGQLMFISAYIGSFNGTEFLGSANNFTNLNLTSSWGGGNSYLTKKYFCGKNSASTLPYAVFDDVTKNFEMFRYFHCRKLQFHIHTPTTLTHNGDYSFIYTGYFHNIVY